MYSTLIGGDLGVPLGGSVEEGGSVDDGPRVKDLGQAQTVVGRCNVRTGGNFNRGFLASLGILGGVIGTTTVAGRSGIVRVKPKLNTLARRLTRTTNRIITLRVSASLLPILSRILSPCSGIGILGRSMLGTSLPTLVRRRFTSPDQPVGIITGLPCCVADPVLVNLLRDPIT